MKTTPIKAIEIQFGKIHDPRINRSKEHKLIDIITIAVCAIICGAQGWTEIELFGNRKYAWLKTFLELPGEIPSHDSFETPDAMASGVSCGREGTRTPDLMCVIHAL